MVVFHFLPHLSGFGCHFKAFDIILAEQLGVCDIVIVVLTICNLTLSSILQKPNKTPTECTLALCDEV